MIDSSSGLPPSASTACHGCSNSTRPPEGRVAAVGGAGVSELHEQRAWWTRAHVTGEVARLIADPTPEAIEVETERIIAMFVSLEVDDDAEYADWGAAKYTSKTIQRAEERVLSAATEDRAEFAVDTVRDPALGDDQVAAVDEIVVAATRADV